ncbi:protein Wnt-8b-like protein, partial [Leptotrombidium deliense]
MSKVCKCHGVSGSCALQTCWMRITEFSNIGRYLKKSYQKALKIDSNENSDNSNSVFKSVSSETNLPNTLLAYTEESPDYCFANDTFSSNGTLGRICSRRKGVNVTLEEKHSCRKLCKQCGYKVK